MERLLVISRNAVLAAALRAPGVEVVEVWPDQVAEGPLDGDADVAVVDVGDDERSLQALALMRRAGQCAPVVVVSPPGGWPAGLRSSPHGPVVVLVPPFTRPGLHAALAEALASGRWSPSDDPPAIGQAGSPAGAAPPPPGHAPDVPTLGTGPRDAPSDVADPPPGRPPRADTAGRPPAGARSLPRPAETPGSVGPAFPAPPVRGGPGPDAGAGLVVAPPTTGGPMQAPGLVATPGPEAHPPTPALPRPAAGPGPAVTPEAAPAPAAALHPAPEPDPAPKPDADGDGDPGRAPERGADATAVPQRAAAPAPAARHAATPRWPPAAPVSPGHLPADAAVPPARHDAPRRAPRPGWRGGPRAGSAPDRGDVAGRGLHPRRDDGRPDGTPGAGPRARAADLATQSLLSLLPELYPVSEVAATVVAELCERTGAEVAALLLPREDLPDGPDQPMLAVAAGRGLRPAEWRLALPADSWLVTTVLRDGNAVLAEGTDVHHHLWGAPVASRRHLLAGPFPAAGALVLLGHDSRAFTPDDLDQVAALRPEAEQLLVTAVRLRRLARALAPFGDLDPTGYAASGQHPQAHNDPDGRDRPAAGGYSR